LPLQEIIGVDKKNPDLTLCRDPERPGELRVFWGAQLLEVVAEDRTNPAFKLLLARLYNAGLKTSALTAAFGVARTTLKRWGDALKSGDPERRVRVLAGRHHPRKLTPEIRGFAKFQFDWIYPEDRYTYSQRIRADILVVFNVAISAESLRPYFNEWKCALNPAIDAEHDATAPAAGITQDTPLSDVSAPQQPIAGAESSASDDRVLGQGIQKVPYSKDLEQTNRKHAVISSEPYRFCHHVGVLLFSAFLTPLTIHCRVGGEAIKQWLVALLLGVVNIEQSKLINWPALHHLLGDQVVANLRQQRQSLKTLALDGALEDVFQLNGEWVGIHESRDFYFDPHTKHYTGTLKILKGWCASIRFADKVLHMDFIHTDQGFPVYFMHDDNFHDMRDRFFDVVGAFRAQFHFNTEPLTFVIDRAIYGLDTFERIMADKPQTYFITWEKNYVGDCQQTIDWTGHHSLYKPRNSSQDLRRFDFNYLDEMWPKQEDIRRLIVRASHPNGNVIQVSILTNDIERCAVKVIELMFNRWLQENDFKYLDKHFGINELTSYVSFSYKELAKIIDDKQIKRGEYKALVKQRTQIKKRLKTVLLNEHRANAKNKKRQDKINALTQELITLEENIAHTDKTESRLDALIEQDYRQLNTSTKSMMDGIKILTRNLFYIQFQPFKEAYNNYRDDHVLFRHLTQAHGFLRNQGNYVEVVLFPAACFQPKVIGIINDMLDKLNRERLVMPDHSERTLHFRLIDSENALFDKC